ncbi:MAG: hypothetical protein J3Q66DRAFT_149721 [Benniella sp.]|nr:MAG: hypothetical protein J3Q66DRAFT_149721 [Benniella sp.]
MPGSATLSQSTHPQPLSTSSVPTSYSVLYPSTRTGMRNPHSWALPHTDKPGRLDTSLRVAVPSLPASDIYSMQCLSPPIPASSPSSPLPLSFCRISCLDMDLKDDNPCSRLQTMGSPAKNDITTVDNQFHVLVDKFQGQSTARLAIGALDIKTIRPSTYDTPNTTTERPACNTSTKPRFTFFTKVQPRPPPAANTTAPSPVSVGYTLNVDKTLHTCSEHSQAAQVKAPTPSPPATISAMTRQSISTTINAGQHGDIDHLKVPTTNVGAGKTPSRKAERQLRVDVMAPASAKSTVDMISTTESLDKLQDATLDTSKGSMVFQRRRVSDCSVSSFPPTKISDDNTRKSNDKMQKSFSTTAKQPTTMEGRIVQRRQNPIYSVDTCSSATESNHCNPTERPIVTSLNSRLSRVPLKKAKDSVVMRQLLMSIKDKRPTYNNQTDNPSVTEKNTDALSAGEGVLNEQDNNSRPNSSISFSKKLQFLKRQEMYRQKNLLHCGEEQVLSQAYQGPPCPSGGIQGHPFPTSCSRLMLTSSAPTPFKTANTLNDPIQRPTFMISPSPSLDMAPENRLTTGSLRASFPECLFQRRSPSPAAVPSPSLSPASNQDHRRRHPSVSRGRKKSEGDVVYNFILEKDSLLRRSCDSSPVGYRSDSDVDQWYGGNVHSSTLSRDDSFTLDPWADRDSTCSIMYEDEGYYADSASSRSSLHGPLLERIDTSSEGEWERTTGISHHRRTHVQEHDISSLTKRLANLQLMDAVCPSAIHLTEKPSKPGQDHTWLSQLHHLITYLAEQADLETKLKHPPNASFLPATHDPSKSIRAGAGVQDSDRTPTGVYEQILRDWIMRLDQREDTIYDGNPWLRREVDKIRLQHGFAKWKPNFREQ